MNIKRLSDFRTKADAVPSTFGFRISIYAATTAFFPGSHAVGIWTELLEDSDLSTEEGPDLQSSFFIGDAADR